MKLSARHLAWAPLLIAGLALLYALVVRLLGEPCPGERVEYIVGHLVTAGFVLYCLAGYWLAVTRAYLAFGIATLWAWQLFVISPVLAPACGGLTRQNLWAEPFGLGFLGFLAAIIVLGIVTSAAMIRRYRVVPALGHGARRAYLLRLLSGTTLAAVLLSLATYLLVPMFLGIYASFGADLPVPTLALFAGYPLAVLIAIPFVAVLLYAARKTEFSDGQLSAGQTGAISLLIALNMLTSGLLFALYAPMVKLCSCV